MRGTRDRILDALRWRIHGIHDFVVSQRWGKAAPLITFTLDRDEIESLEAIFSNSPIMLISAGGASSDHTYSNLPASTYEDLNRTLVFRDSETMIPTLEKIIEKHSAQIREGTASPFVIVNVRSWETIPRPPDEVPLGPGEWHTDGFAPGYLKLMIYIDGLGTSVGSIVFEEEMDQITGPKGTCVLFENSKLTHRAYPASGDNRRPIVEVTLHRAFYAQKRVFAITGGPDSRHWTSPFVSYKARSHA